ncbi:ester cyclase [Streptomyces sp. 6N223]|uniref:ester cyclase n=1 Tax=Streptomyces sp. 6N223 TaxID=3457412 RepID=UPI003FD08B13
MSFIQVIDCKTSRVEELNRLMDDWVSITQGKRTATHSIVGKDRADPTHVLEIVEFPSYEEAMRNSKLPETDRIYQEMVALCDAPPQFTDLEVIRDEQLNKAASRRFFEAITSGDASALEELLTNDYQDHDPASPTDPQDLAAFTETTRMYVDAFGPSFAIENQLAEGDRVTTAWTVTGTHRGEFQGVEPTGRRITVTGHTTHRYREGRICEGHWNWDYYGLLEQLGIIAV